MLSKTTWTNNIINTPKINLSVNSILTSRTRCLKNHRAENLFHPYLNQKSEASGRYIDTMYLVQREKFPDVVCSIAVYPL